MRRVRSLFFLDGSELGEGGGVGFLPGGGGVRKKKHMGTLAQRKSDGIQSRISFDDAELIKGRTGQKQRY